MQIDGVANVAESPTELRRNAVGLAGVMMQALTDVAPAIAVLFTVQFTASQAGISMPAAYVGAFLIAIPIAVVLCQLARRLPSAGGWYTYVSRGVHPRAGFLVAWLYFLYAPLQTAITGTSIGVAFASTIQSEYGVNIPWWIFMLAIIVFVVVMAYRGISFSTRAIVILGFLELAIVGVFSVWGFFQSGPGGVTLQVFNPANAPTGAGEGFGLAVVFAIFALNGWDGAVPLAEESRDPKRVVPRAVFLALGIMGFFLIICAWGILSGWGTNNIHSFVSSSEAPYIVLAKKFWSSAGVPILLLALLNSALAVTIASTNVTTRMWFSMARSGALPHQLAKLNPRFKTPVNALFLQTIISVVAGLGVAALIGPAKVFDVVGLMFTFALIPVFILGALACFLLYWREWRSEFNWLLHVVSPIITCVALLTVGYYSLNPAPVYPFDWALPICAAWLVVGGIILVVLKIRGNETWMRTAGEAQMDRPAGVTAGQAGEGGDAA
jgi:amino acid transporter